MGKSTTLPRHPTTSRRKTSVGKQLPKMMPEERRRLQSNAGQHFVAPPASATVFDVGVVPSDDILSKALVNIRDNAPTILSPISDMEDDIFQPSPTLGLPKRSSPKQLKPSKPSEASKPSRPSQPSKPAKRGRGMEKSQKVDHQSSVLRQMLQKPKSKVVVVAQHIVAPQDPRPQTIVREEPIQPIDEGELITPITAPLVFQETGPGQLQDHLKVMAWLTAPEQYAAPLVEEATPLAPQPAPTQAVQMDASPIETTRSDNSDDEIQCSQASDQDIVSAFFQLMERLNKKDAERDRRDSEVRRTLEEKRQHRAMLLEQLRVVDNDIRSLELDVENIERMKKKSEREKILKRLNGRMARK